jgi:hypothetical protein
MIIFYIILFLLLVCVLLLYDYEQNNEIELYSSDMSSSERDALIGLSVAASVHPVGALALGGYGVYKAIDTDRRKRQRNRDRRAEEQRRLQDFGRRVRLERQRINETFDEEWEEYKFYVQLVNKIIVIGTNLIKSYNLSPYDTDKPEPDAGTEAPEEMVLGVNEIVRPNLNADHQYILSLHGRTDTGNTVKYDNRRMKMTGTKDNDRDYHERVRIYWATGIDFVLLEKWNGDGDKFIHRRGEEVYYGGGKDHEGRNHGNNKFNGSKNNTNQRFRLYNVRENDPTVFKIKHDSGAFVGHPTESQSSIGRDKELKFVDESRAYTFEMCHFHGNHCKDIDFQKKQEAEPAAAFVEETDYSKKQVDELRSKIDEIQTYMVKMLGLSGDISYDTPHQRNIQKYICIYNLRDAFVGHTTNSVRNKLYIEELISEYTNTEFQIPPLREPKSYEVQMYKTDIIYLLYHFIMTKIDQADTISNGNIHNGVETTINGNPCSLLIDFEIHEIQKLFDKFIFVAEEISQRVETIIQTSLADTSNDLLEATSFITKCENINQECVRDLETINNTSNVSKNHETVFSTYNSRIGVTNRFHVAVINEMFDKIIHFLLGKDQNGNKIYETLLDQETVYYLNYVFYYETPLVTEYLKVDTTKDLDCDTVNLILSEMQFIIYTYNVYIKQAMHADKNKIDELMRRYENGEDIMTILHNFENQKVNRVVLPGPVESSSNVRDVNWLAPNFDIGNYAAVKPTMWNNQNLTIQTDNNMYCKINSQNNIDCSSIMIDENDDDYIFKFMSFENPANKINSPEVLLTDYRKNGDLNLHSLHGRANSAPNTSICSDRGNDGLRCNWDFKNRLEAYKVYQDKSKKNENIFKIQGMNNREDNTGYPNSDRGGFCKYVDGKIKCSGTNTSPATGDDFTITSPYSTSSTPASSDSTDRSFRKYPDWDYGVFGTALRTIDNATNIEVCKSECEKEPNCTGVVTNIHKGRNDCWLKESGGKGLNRRKGGVDSYVLEANSPMVQVNDVTWKAGLSEPNLQNGQGAYCNPLAHSSWTCQNRTSTREDVIKICENDPNCYAVREVRHTGGAAYWNTYGRDSAMDKGKDRDHSLSTEWGDTIFYKQIPGYTYTRPGSSDDPKYELHTNEELRVDQSLRKSCNMLVLQSDGNLVLYGENGTIALWSSDTWNSGSNRLIMQSDGNLVLYNNEGAVWSSGTTGQGANRLVVQDDGNLVLYTAQNVAIWATNTNYNCQAVAQFSQRVAERMEDLFNFDFPFR